MKILFLTKYPEKGASSRYRVFQYLDVYRAAGHEIVVQSFMDDALYDLSLSHGQFLRKSWMTIGAILRRLHTLWQHRDAALFYMQRELFPVGPPILERRLKRQGKRLVFDYDDALFLKKPSRYNRLASFFRSTQKISESIALADLTIAGNNWLRDQAIAFGGRAITVEVAEDTHRYAPKQSNQTPVTIGWLGSPSTSKYLHLIADQLREVARTHPEVKWIMVGGGDFSMQGVPWVLRDWSIAAEKQALFEFDIGLMPLPTDEWSLGKSGGKARTYMAAGVVPVVTAIGYNLELVRDGVTGVLIEDKAQWQPAIKELILDAARRKKMSTAAIEDVKERFSVEGQALKILQAMEGLIGDH